MSLMGLLENSQLISEKILSYLDAKSLAQFGSCCRSFRKIANSSLLWNKLCKQNSYERFHFLLSLDNHASIPFKSTSSTPIYLKYETDTLDELNEWREVFNRAEHLVKNWRSGIYFVAPVLRGHKGRINAFDCDGSVIASGSSDENIVKIWSVEECECVNTIKLKPDSINCLKIYKTFVIVAGEDGIIRIYDQIQGDLKHTFVNNNSNGGVSKMIILNDKLLAVFTDKSIRGWSLKNNEMLFILRGHEDDIESISSYENFLISGSWDRTIILWDIETGSRLVKLVGHTEVINCLKMKKNRIVSGSSDSTVRIWNLEITDQLNSSQMSKKKLIVHSSEPILLVGHQSDVYCVEIYNDFIVSGGADSLVIVWNCFGDLLYKLSGHLGIVRSLYIDDFKLVSGGDAKKIIVWDYKVGKLLNVIYRNPNKLNSMWVDETKIITESPETVSTITLICYW